LTKRAVHYMINVAWY